MQHDPEDEEAAVAQLHSVLVTSPGDGCPEPVCCVADSARQSGEGRARSMRRAGEGVLGDTGLFTRRLSYE